MPKFTADWVVEGSFQETLRNLMAKADSGALAGLSPEQITDALIDELRFISLYSEQEERELEEYLRRRAQYGREVSSHIARQLRELGPEQLRRIALALAQLADEDKDIVKLVSTASAEELAVTTAAQMISFPDVTIVIRYLVSLMEDLEQKEKEKVANIASHLLPFNYAPRVVLELTEQIQKSQLGLVEDTVSTRTLAEVIMAGYDGKPVKYTRRLDKGELRGKPAFDAEEEPEEGPSVIRAARNLLIELLALKGTVLEAPKQARPGADGESETQILRDIEAYATELRGLLTALRTIHGGRTAYCVLQLPEKTDPKKIKQRAFRIAVLREVAHYVRELPFVELVRPSPGHERDSELTGYMKFIQAQVLPL